MNPGFFSAVVLTLLAFLCPQSYAQGGPSPAKIMERMDADGDGKIARQEWRGPPPRFNRLDSNSDGFLSVEELEAITGQKTAIVRNKQPAIDVHTHIHAHPNSSPEERQHYNYTAAAAAAISEMDKNNVRISIIMPPPGIKEKPDDEQGVIDQMSRMPERFTALGGGATLNPIIQTTPPGKVTEKIKQRFTAKAEDILKHGAAGFGEMAALHFSFFTYHPFEESPPDHPLFLLLADIAASHDVPIDLHNEIVLADMDTPAELLKRSKRNPPRVKENLKAFERLLSHNENARIVLSHSTDSTGGRKASIIRGLLERHPNLYMSLNVMPGFLFLQNLPLKPRGPVAPEWLQLIEDYPDRFLIGSDQFFIAPCAGCKTADSFTPTLRWLSAVPPEIARKIALENPGRVYKID
jgi:hypothetical protein